MKLIIASRNIHKIREIKAMLRGNPEWDLFSLLDFPSYEPPEETGSSFEENATTKAVHAAKTLGAWALGDDSGLVVPALSGAPGIRSARYAKEGATDKENRKKLLKEMENLKEDERSAYFACSMVLASREKVEKVVNARCEGRILTSEAGGQGFGYDSIFVKNDYSKTFAELDEETKNRVSHRRRALDQILLFLQSGALHR